MTDQCSHPRYLAARLSVILSLLSIPSEQGRFKSGRYDVCIMNLRRRRVFVGGTAAISLNSPPTRQGIFRSRGIFGVAFWLARSRPFDAATANANSKTHCCDISVEFSDLVYLHQLGTTLIAGWYARLTGREFAHP